MSFWIDSHAHLEDDAFADDQPQVLARAQEASVGQVICVASDLASARRCLDLARQHSWVFATAGIHPHEAEAAGADDMTALAELAADPKVVAIGEAGLDYHYNFSSPAGQRERLEQNIALAKATHKPLIIHVREAHQDLMSIFSASAPLPQGVIHCFSGTLPQARQYLDCGLYLSFSGLITFPKAEEIKEVAKWAPADRILVETDSPYLAPVPHRGRRNEPAHVVRTGEALARLRGLPVEELAQLTTSNSRTLFGLPALG